MIWKIVLVGAGVRVGRGSDALQKRGLGGVDSAAGSGGGPGGPGKRVSGWMVWARGGGTVWCPWRKQGDLGGCLLWAVLGVSGFVVGAGSHLTPPVLGAAFGWYLY